eukprot:1158188-Pelagomonas_calceolata.AAC.6
MHGQAWGEGGTYWRYWLHPACIGSSRCSPGAGWVGRACGRWTCGKPVLQAWAPVGGWDECMQQAGAASTGLVAWDDRVLEMSTINTSAHAHARAQNL